MKDPLGHGSNGHGSCYLMPNGRSVMPSRPAGSPPKANDNVVELRARLSTPKQGLLHKFTSGIKSALGRD